MSCCDTGRCVVEDPDPEPPREPDCQGCGDTGVYYDYFLDAPFPCPCKEVLGG